MSCNSYSHTNLRSFIFGLAYWYFWTAALLKWYRYRLENEIGVLDDGATFTRLTRKGL
jgi:hypothetical protein